MSLDPVNTPESALSRIQNCIDQIGQLKGSGELTVIDGKTQVVKKGFFGRLWSKIRGRKPDPVRNAAALGQMQADFAEGIKILNEYLKDPDKPQRNKDAMLNDLMSVLGKVDSSALKDYEARMEKELARSAEGAHVDLEDAKQYFSQGRLENIPGVFKGDTKGKMERMVSFMRIAGPAARISSLTEVRTLSHNRNASEVSKLEALMTNAYALVTSDDSLDDFAADFLSKLPPKEAAAAAPAPPPPITEEGVAAPPPPPTGGAAPPPPPMSPEQAQKLAAENKKKEEALRKAEAERKKQQEIAGVKEEQKQLAKDIKDVEGKIADMSGKTKGMQARIKEMRVEYKRQEKLYGSNKEFVRYEKALADIDRARSAKTEAKAKLDAFEAEMKSSAAALRKFLDSAKKEITMPTLRRIQNPETKEDELVEGSVTLSRKRAEQLLKDEYEIPLKELKESFENTSRSVENMESTIANLKGMSIEGKPFSEVAASYHGMKEKFAGLEEELKKANNEKFILQDRVKGLRDKENDLEAKLAKLESRDVVVKNFPKKGFDPTEVQRKLKEGGPVHLRDFNLKGRVKVEKPVNEPAKQVEERENVNPQRGSTKKAARSVFRNLFGRRKDLS